MKNPIVPALLLTLAGSALAAAPVAQPAASCSPYNMSVQDASRSIGDWPAVSRDAADAMLAKYGAPTYGDSSSLVWKDKTPFKKIVVARDGIRHAFPTEHQDVLSQELGMKVPLNKVDALARFDSSIIVDRTKGTVTARSDSETHNILALNLAKDIIDGKRTVASAQKVFADTLAKTAAGKSSAYAQDLVFLPDNNAADPGRPYSAKPAEPLTPMPGASTGGSLPGDAPR